MKALFDNPVLLIVVLLIIVLLFGAKKLPELAGSIAKSMNIFKAEAKSGKREEEKPSSSSSSERTDSAPGRPLEGRVVDDAPTPRADQTSYESQQRHSA